MKKVPNKSRVHKYNIFKPKNTSTKISEQKINELLIKVDKMITLNEIHLMKLDQRENLLGNSGYILENHCSLGWNGNNEQLYKLHSGLVKMGFIKIKFNELKTRFTAQQCTRKKVQWFSSESKLVFLFEELKAQGLIKFEKNRFKTLSKHFLNSNGSEYKPHQLTTVNEQNKNRKQNQFKELEKLIKSVRRIRDKKY